MLENDASARPRSPRYAEQLREIAALTREYRERLAARLDVNDSALRAMELLMMHGPSTPGELAAAMSITPGAMTTIVDRLEATSHAHRSRDDNDRRRVLVVPAPASVAAARAQLTPLLRELDSRVSAYSDAERALVERFLSDVEESYRVGIAAIAVPDSGGTGPRA